MSTARSRFAGVIFIYGNRYYFSPIFKAKWWLCVSRITSQTNLAVKFSFMLYHWLGKCSKITSSNSVESIGLVKMQSMRMRVLAQCVLRQVSTMKWIQDELAFANHEYSENSNNTLKAFQQPGLLRLVGTGDADHQLWSIFNFIIPMKSKADW